MNKLQRLLCNNVQNSVPSCQPVGGCGQGPDLDSSGLEQPRMQPKMGCRIVQLEFKIVKSLN